ncbi:Dabb family protein [Agrobacterium larrymoorei]|uniref:Dabb family protein n=1 Tax=Agrobacterium larrymoorei TaxID=160699 RepID=A0A4D7DLW6_9HYPH|nr:Dabb family protein [Agrobacterium larrymoorei]QCI98513.1 Dabb family protein [Agrobacterium larrymoorei]QYA06023.1 Dabb family protein [Agrobacterium larrymoorei]WHA40626.1 Dabb family protein [Agrobacterium larrymoorei]
MIQHCVFLRFKSATTPSEKTAIYEAIAALKDVIPGITDIKYGQNVSPEGLNGGFLDGFIVNFDSLEARDEYLVHPQHVEVGDRLIGLTDGGLAGILVFDMAV